MNPVSIKLNSTIKMSLWELIKSRLLIQANSGGGKSWLIRRIVEQAFGKVQIIILDPEGEFASLREKYDFVLAGKGADAVAEPRSAELLARKALEHKFSLIVDLYELSMQERKRFVRLFLDGLVNAPKELWHPVLVILDEAHIFAPEKGQSEAFEAVEALATRGRKRGFCAILATQRIAKLNKDVAAELNNKLIGRASQDVDRKRAAEEIGFSSAEDVRSLRTLKPGEFHAFGPAISDDVIKFKVGGVQTSHERTHKSGGYKVVPPTPGIKKVLSKLADLPAEAEEEARTVAELKARIREMKKSVSVVPATKEVVKIKEVPILKDSQIKKLEKIFSNMVKEAERHGAAMALLWGHFNELGDSLMKVVEYAKHPVVVGTAISSKELKIEPGRIMHFPEKDVPAPEDGRGLVEVVTVGVTGPEQRIIDAIRWFETIGIEAPEQTAVAFLAGYTYGGGGFNNPRGSLRTKRMVEYRGDQIVLTEKGRQLAREPVGARTNEELQRKVLSILPGPEKKLLIPLIGVYPGEMTKESLAEVSGYKFGTGGFNNPCGRLRTLGLIEYPRSGYVKAKSLLFPNA